MHALLGAIPVTATYVWGKSNVVRACTTTHVTSHMGPQYWVTRDVDSGLGQDCALHFIFIDASSKL